MVGACGSGRWVFGFGGAVNAPARVCLATALFLAIFLAAVFWLPELPIWAYLLMIPVFYKVQSWSHKVWTSRRT